jgi:hypothetical protein
MVALMPLSILSNSSPLAATNDHTNLFLRQLSPPWAALSSLGSSLLLGQLSPPWAALSSLGSSLLLGQLSPPSEAISFWGSFRLITSSFHGGFLLQQSSPTTLSISTLLNARGSTVSDPQKRRDITMKTLISFEKAGCHTIYQREAPARHVLR